MSSPRSILLALFGLAAFVTGVVLGNEAAGISLIVLGASILCLGVLLPVVQEASIGKEGFKFTKILRQRDDDFRRFVEAQQESLRRLVVLVTGDPKASASVVEDALAQAYGEWGFVASDRRSYFLLCNAIRKAIGAFRIGLTVPHPEEVPAGARPLLAMGLEARAVALLHYYRDLSESDIARIMDVDREDVRSILREVDSQLEPIWPPALPPGSGTPVPKVVLPDHQPTPLQDLQ